MCRVYELLALHIYTCCTVIPVIINRELVKSRFYSDLEMSIMGSLLFYINVGCIKIGQLKSQHPHHFVIQTDVMCPFHGPALTHVSTKMNTTATMSWYVYVEFELEKVSVYHIDNTILRKSSLCVSLHEQ